MLDDTFEQTKTREEPHGLVRTRSFPSAPADHNRTAVTFGSICLLCTYRLTSSAAACPFLEDVESDLHISISGTAFLESRPLQNARSVNVSERLKSVYALCSYLQRLPKPPFPCICNWFERNEFIYGNCRWGASQPGRLESEHLPTCAWIAWKGLKLYCCCIGNQSAFTTSHLCLFNHSFGLCLFTAHLCNFSVRIPHGHSLKFIFVYLNELSIVMILI